MANLFIKSIQNSVKNWWIPLLIGILFIITGIYTFTSPAEAYVALAIVFAINFLLSGILEIIYALSNQKIIDNWGWSLIFGLLNTLVGVMLVSNIGLTMITLPFYIGFLIMFRSFAFIGLSMDLKNYGDTHSGLFMVMGILGVILSIIFLWKPTFGGMTIVFWTGILFFISGIFNIYFALRMRNIHKNWDKVSKDVKSRFQEIQEEIQKELNQ
ncbi:MAG: HdeD family acid-resistance protein [Moheibacter sp.]